MESDEHFFSEQARVLIPLRLPDEDEVSDWLIRFLQAARVFVLGCYVVPDQTSPEQAREQFEEGARESLSAVTKRFEELDARVDSELVFTPDFVQTVERVSKDLKIDGIIRPRPAGPITSMLAVVSGDINYDRLVKCIRELVAGEIERLKLLVAESSEREQEQQEVVLDGLYERLVDSDVPEEVIEMESVRSDDPAQTVIEQAEGFGVLVVAEQVGSAADWVLRPMDERVLEGSELPVVVVRLGE